MGYLIASTLANELMPPIPTVTGSSVPLSLAETDTIISRTSAEIDTAVAVAGYALPVSSGASGFVFLQQVCKYGAGWKILRSFFPNQGGPGDKSSLAAEYRDAYREALIAIRGGDVPIIGATLDTSETTRLLPRSFSTSNPGATAGVIPQVDIDTIF